MTVIGRSGAGRFRSKDGAGEWIRLESKVGTNLRKGETLKVPSNAEADIASRSWKGQVPSLGILIKGTVVSDGVAGSNDLYTTRLSLGSFFEVSVDIATTSKKLNSKTLNLAQWHFLHQIINARAANLDRRFYDDDNEMIGPFMGMDSENVALSDVGFANSGARPLASRNADRYPAMDLRSSYWRAMEGKTLIRSATNVETEFTFLYSFPLCYGTIYGLEADSVPLATLCDTTHLTSVNVKLPREFNDTTRGAIVHTTRGGSVSIDTVGLYAYVKYVKAESPRHAGNLYHVRQDTISETDIKLPKNELVLFHGNLPQCTPTVGALRTRVIDGDAYALQIAYGNYNPDFASGNSAEFYIGNEIHFPPDSKRRSPRQLYEKWWNPAAEYGTLERPFIRSGRFDQVATIAGWDASAGLGYANRIDEGTLSEMLDLFTNFPVRAIAATTLEMDGMPGFSALDASCPEPHVKLEGTWDNSGGLSSINNTFTVVANRDDADVTRLRDLGASCCKLGTVKWKTIHAEPTHPAAQVLIPFLPALEDLQPSVSAGKA